MIAAFLWVAKLLPARSWLILGALAGVLAIGLAIYFAGRGDERDAQADRIAKTEARASTARETASDERAIDTANLNARERDLTDAVQSLPDARPSARRIALACERLRQQRSRLPPECGPEGSS